MDIATTLQDKEKLVFAHNEVSWNILYTLIGSYILKECSWGVHVNYEFHLFGNFLDHFLFETLKLPQECKGILTGWEMDLFSDMEMDETHMKVPRY
jgi:hypothetical protein